ncbi:hypothetical protein XBFM1_920003 [Xenorhabdus bovienii str. feltiae Moldova]|uniref:Uncharacterized protein n=1 Tax=Xenorhabdus bovienii str. feltiae Moldova TaxID=1398200 RepID=A0A077NYY3_XENBV|nr:hypothetical protein XBFM1_920003 [Xenorhabdus bovienii str. feltiae Moldova]
MFTHSLSFFLFFCLVFILCFVYRFVQCSMYKQLYKQARTNAFKNEGYLFNINRLCLNCEYRLFIITQGCFHGVY